MQHFHWSRFEERKVKLQERTVCLLAELGDIRGIAGRLQKIMGPALCAVHLCHAAASMASQQQLCGWAATKADAHERHDLR